MDSFTKLLNTIRRATPYHPRDDLSKIRDAILTLIEVGKQLQYDHDKFLVACRGWERYIETGDNRGVNPRVIQARMAALTRWHFRIQREEMIRLAPLLTPHGLPPPDYAIKELWHLWQPIESTLLSWGRPHSTK